ncbi:hypothetical protein ACIPF8_03095 [Collimonas sp. NPDC087041]|uniref:hypothetical protein n=1 Tax=Collimonas sp. NPDC087041 TaxID=3363960 RepID=UPI0037F6B1B9
MANIIGLVILAALMTLMSLYVPGSEVPGVFWVFIYVIWAAFAYFIWHHRKAPESATRWLILAALSVIGAALWFGIATLIAHLSFGGNEPGLSKIFDVTVALIIAPGLTFIALAGWVRALVVIRKTRSAKP